MREALADEPLIADALGDQRVAPLLAPLADPPLSRRQALGLDLILEGFLLHRGRPRSLTAPDRDQALLLGDYCYARGLVRVAETGDLYAIEALSELIASSTGHVADGGSVDGLAALWRATVGAIAGDAPAREALSGAREALAAGDPAPVNTIGERLGVPTELSAFLESEPARSDAA